MATKSEDAENPNEPAKTDEFQSAADGPTFFRYLPRNATQEQINNTIGRPWFYNWMLSDEARAKPATYVIYYDDEPSEPEASTHTAAGAAADGDSPSSDNPADDPLGDDKRPNENINKPGSDK